jgi:DNA excision repair protein ERCC-1
MVLAVNSNQKGNPVLNKFKAQSWTYEEIVPDYQIGKSNGLLFLSLKYHRIHPEYIQPRLIQLENFNTKILLVLVDISQAQNSIRELSILAIDHNFQVVLAWTDEDAAKYIETFKKYESKTPESIREKVDESSFSKFSNFIAQIKSVNKTDVVTLSSHFKVRKILS